MSADEFLSPALQQISKTFRLSESLAGVTLLAFGAGAPDVFASLSASEGATSDGIHMGISVLLGASLFILAIVTSVVILYSPTPIKLNSTFFLRDCAFLMTALSILLYSMLGPGYLGVPVSITLIAVYVLYCIIVFLQDRSYVRSLEEAQKAKQANTELGNIVTYGVPKKKDFKADKDEQAGALLIKEE